MSSVIINNSQKNGFNIFDQWKETQREILTEKANNLKEKKQFVWKYENEYKSILASIRKYPKENGYDFSLPTLVRIIRYLNTSNSFFNNRVSSDEMDEYLILIYLYEWLYLGKDKDENVLGSKSEVIRKFKMVTKKTESDNRKLFENPEYDYEENYEKFVRGLHSAISKTYNKLIDVITNDGDYFNKIKLDNFDQLNITDEYLKKLWVDTFTIVDENITYSYSAYNSDDIFIYINVEFKNEQIAFVKFRMFETFTFRNGSILPNGISKELLRIEFLNKQADNIASRILSNSLKLANRVVKHIFLREVKARMEDTGNKKVVNIIPKK